MRIIGITGKARSGKDTLAKLLLSAVPGSVQMSFAAPIREFVARLIGVPVDVLQDGPFKEAPLPSLSGTSPRQMMQTLGTEWGRRLIDPDLWIKVASWDLGAHKLAGVPLVVFSDVRFDNEAEMIRRAGGVIVHLERTAAAAVNAHSSEAGITPGIADWTIVNNRGVRDLENDAKKLLSFHSHGASSKTMAN